MPFIEVIDPGSAQGKLARIYSGVSGPNGQVDRVLQIHSLRPHTLEGHMALYKAVLHHPRNVLPTWFLEAIGVRVSLLNNCRYCADHHRAGMKRLMSDAPDKFEACAAESGKEQPGEPFTAAQQAALVYAGKLTLQPGDISAEDVETMRQAGLSDGEILEINQVAGYFAYANRTVTGLGVTTEGEELGLAPDESDSWQHA